MNKWAIVASGAWMVGSACVLSEEPLRYGSCEQSRRECEIVYSSFYGYYRACNTVATPCVDPYASSNEGSEEEEEEEETAEPSAPASTTPSTELAGGTSTDAEAPPSNPSAAPPPERTRYSAFDIPCERDSQCGPGKCLDGDCYYGCNSDAQCGSGDRCAVEDGTRICRPDPNPPVVCTRSAQCEGGFTCLNGSCRQSCTATEQCDNLLDRCASGVCLPDRRPLGECVLNSECAEGLVCLDGACVAACPAPARDGVCLSEPDDGTGPTPAGEEPSSPGQPSQPGEDSAADAGAAPINSIQ